MKKRFLVLGTLAMAAALALVGCDHSSGGKSNGSDPTEAQTWAEGLGGFKSDEASYSGTTVTLKKDVTINGPAASSVTALRAAADGAYTIPTGGRLVVPQGRKLTVAQGGKLNTKGTLELKDKTSAGNGGSFVVEDGEVTLGGPVEAKAAASITINGGKVTIGSTITAGANAEINFTGGDITIKTTANIKASDGIKTADKPTIRIDVEIKKETGAKIDEDNIKVITDDTTGGKITEVAPAPDPGDPAIPVLTSGPTVTYSDNNGNVTAKVTYNFNMKVSAAATDTWAIAGNGTATITAIPTEPASGTPVPITLTATNAADQTKTVTVPAVTVMPVSELLARPSSGSAAYTVAYYDKNGAVGLKTGGGTTWYYVPPGISFKNTGLPLRNIFNAVYTPNAPNTADEIETGKTTVAYTDTISAAALSLFTVTIGASADDDKLEIKGTGLPVASGASNQKPIVIDIGIPDENNSSLKFYIPCQGLGASGGTYSHIRFRVNRGAETVILADNSSYIASGAGHSCATGYFNNGCIEVMEGGKLRDGAYEGFPLGSNAVILSRLGSYLAVGPESSFSSSTAGYVENLDKWYTNWLIGPEGDSPRIQWGSGDQNGDYIEVRQGRLAISANVTVKKTLGLIYSVWFVNGPTITIDAANDSLQIGGKKGLFANGTAYKFYGTKADTGGQNTGAATATIVINSGSTLHKAFLTSGNADSNNFITADGSAKTITNRGNEGGTASTPYVDGATGITGYLNWNIPQ
jgi:hypothetical protein